MLADCRRCYDLGPLLGDYTPEFLLHLSPLALEPLAAGLVIGAVIGACALPINFCALGAVADILFARDWRRMRAWMLAAGVAILGIQGLAAVGLIRAPIGVIPGYWGAWAAIACGGVMFGYGMALSGGCINRALVRIGAGSFKSFLVVTVAGAAAALTTVYLPRSALLQALIPATPGPMQWVSGALAGGALVVFALADSWFRSSKRDIAGSIVIGLCIPAAWAVGAVVEGHPTMVNFIPPAGDLARLVAGQGPAEIFSPAILLGVPLGACLAAVVTGSLGFETFADGRDLIRNTVGAILMGVGGTLALGCTFGQGLSGLAALSFAAVIAIAGMVFGCLWGIRAFEAGGVWAGLKLTATLLKRR